jgi:intracellular multiplication protein IcmL
MALDDVQELYEAKDNDFYKYHYHQLIIALMFFMVVMMIALGVVFYQILNRPLPQFNAVQPDGKSMLLIPAEEPNLLPDTIIRWASKAATVAYTFDFVGYNNQLNAARPYFTVDGWQEYLGSVNQLITRVRQNQLFVNGVVSGPPVISNQGELPGKGYVWRVQIPFLVTNQSANIASKQNFLVILSIVRVPTSENKQGIGIDQFVMRER